VTEKISDLESFSGSEIVGHRLINAKFPLIYLFEDVADAAEFEDLYAIQAITNPRIQTEVGNLSLLSLDEIPFGIPGCRYAAASFTHVNPEGSRFSDGSYGLMYIGDSSDTAVAEVKYHQNIYWSNIPNLRYDRFVFKELICNFGVMSGLDATTLPKDTLIYKADDYSYSRRLGWEIKQAGEYSALKYASVRNEKGVCFALFTPKEVVGVIQSKHYEMIWDGVRISSVNLILKGETGASAEGSGAL